MKICSAKSFSDIIRWRIRGLYLLLFLMLIYMVIIGELNLGDSRMMTDLAETISRVIFFGGMLWVIHKIVHNKRLLRDARSLKEELIRERDERNQYLHDKSGGLVWDILFICLLFATLTASLTNMPAFYTAFSLLCIAILLKLIFLFIHKNLE